MDPTDPDMTSGTDVKSRSRAKLLAAATDLLVEGGPKAVTVDAVAERSGVAKSTLYRHWRSVDELLLAVVRANVPESVPADLASGFESALRSWVAHAVATLSAPDWPRVLSALLELRTTSPDMAALLESDIDEKLSAVDAILALGAAEGAIPAGLDARLVMQTLVGPIVLATLSGDQEHASSLADFVTARFLDSYRTR
ncbi:MAG: TetR/AcrR family transcriptional regulator [Actinobacteria bacterium]|nr:TetR/AcrR family transcriptional regulator [Actinomycetota bacterium]